MIHYTFLRFKKGFLMTPNIRHLSSTIASIVLIGCGGGGSTGDDTTGGETLPPSNINISITDDIHVQSLGTINTIHADISVGSTPKSLYILLSNQSKTSSSLPNIKHNKMVDNRQKKATFTNHPLPLLKQKGALHAPEYILAFASKSKALLKKNESTASLAKIMQPTSRREDVADTQKTFYLNADGTSTTTATAKKIVSNINTPFGNKTLNIWVSDDSFGLGCDKAKCVTQVMVDELADTFLKAGEDNDIYDWVTNIYGEEWGNDAQAKYSNLISTNDEITILLTDIDNDNSKTGGVVGFFWSKDNFENTSISGSNERVMFYADAVMFANGEGEWNIDDFWPKEMVSTLAHEFQHMIHFYQKEVLLLTGNENTDVWINEMLSETTEDLIATKIHHIGPRGVEYTDGSAGASGNTNGRYPLFNENNTLSLTAWNNSLADYSKVNAFGTYLIRNYGGAKLLHDIMYNKYIDEQAVIDAVHQSANGSGKTFADLQREWGVAVLLSDNDNLNNVPTYNTGDFTLDTYNSVAYEIGSINFFNYAPMPTISTSTGTVSSQGNYYYKVGDALTGNVRIDLDLDGSTEATLVAK